MADDTMFSIGELAARTGVSRDTLRYYERLGLLPRAPRTSGGFRLYSPETVDRLRFIQRAQSMGFTLEEIRELVTFDGQGGIKRCQRVRDLLATKLQELDARLSELRAFRRTLRESLELCDRSLAQHANGECPVVEPLHAPRLQRGGRSRGPAGESEVTEGMPRRDAIRSGT